MKIRKIVAVLMVVNLILLTVVIKPYGVEAAYSKVATAAAKKAAKELVKDNAVQMAMDIVFNYEMEQIMKDGYKVDEGYTAACLDGKSTCDKPVQVKKVITQSEKVSIGNKVEEILEQKSGTTGFVKFLDWFVPIFLLGTAVNWIMAELDPDSEGLFDEIAKQALIDLGIIKPVTPVNVVDTPIMPDITGVENVPSGTTVQIDDRQFSKEYVFGLDGSTVNSLTFTSDFYSSVGWWKLELVKSNNDGTLGVSNINFYGQNADGSKRLGLAKYNPSYRSSFNTMFYTGLYGVTNTQGVAFVDGVRKTGFENYNKNNGFFGAYATKIKEAYLAPIKVVAGTDPILKSIRSSSGIDANHFYTISYMKVLQDDGEVWEMFLSQGHSSMPSAISYNQFKVEVSTTALHLNQIAVRVSYSGDGDFSSNPIYVPKFDEVNVEGISDGKPMKVVPPVAIPVTTPEGTPVKPDGIGGWTDLSGAPVPVDEDTLVVGDVVPTPEGDGVVAPDGTPILKPEDTTTVPDDKEEPELACSRGFKDIEFKKVGTAFSNVFPFSIPFDIKRYIDNSFAGIGDEKPEFELSFLGDGVVLKIPDYFDSWVSFGKGLVIIVFDVGLLYLFYRIMKGGNV